MTNQQLCQYLLTQDPNAKITARFQGRVLEIKDIYDTELILDPIKKEKKTINNDFMVKAKAEKTHVPFVSEVEEFNDTFGKPNNYVPTIPNDKKLIDFVIDFIKEETEELEHAIQEKDIVEVLDAICDLLYVAIGNTTMVFGLKDKLIPAFKEVQASNMSKVCETEKTAKITAAQRSIEQGEPCHYKKVGDVYVVYRTRDNKVMKSINYFRPDLKQFFTDQELQNIGK